MQVKNQTVNGRRNNFQDNSNNSQKEIFEKGEHSFSYINSMKIE